MYIHTCVISISVNVIHIVIIIVIFIIFIIIIIIIIIIMIICDVHLQVKQHVAVAREEGVAKAVLAPHHLDARGTPDALAEGEQFCELCLLLDVFALHIVVCLFNVMSWLLLFSPGRARTAPLRSSTSRWPGPRQRGGSSLPCSRLRPSPRSAPLRGGGMILLTEILSARIARWRIACLSSII